MKLVTFTKIFKDKSIGELIELAHECSFDGYDLCVRPGYAVNPENASTALPQAVEQLARAGLSVPMATGNFDLLLPDHPDAEPILSALDKADVRLIKLGYFKFNPATQDYWKEVDRIRAALEGWQALARRHNVKVCYHTHSNRCMGVNAAAIAHLLRGFDPQAVGAYLDPGHLAIEGEEFCFGAAMVRDYLCAVGLKDFLLTRHERNGHGTTQATCVPAGAGMVDWTAVFDILRDLKFSGPFSVHCEFEFKDMTEFNKLLRAEIQAFRAYGASA